MTCHQSAIDAALGHQQGRDIALPFRSVPTISHRVLKLSVSDWAPFLSRDSLRAMVPQVQRCHLRFPKGLQLQAQHASMCSAQQRLHRPVILLVSVLTRVSSFMQHANVDQVSWNETQSLVSRLGYSYSGRRGQEAAKLLLTKARQNPGMQQRLLHKSLPACSSTSMLMSRIPNSKLVCTAEHVPAV